jgi:cation:H+ antiporter
MLLAVAFLLAGALLLFVGAESVVRGSASIAVRAGVTPLVIGLTVVAFGTSAPELIVSVSAALTGYGAIAVGNVVGSNISNIALILGITAIIAPPEIHAQVIRRDLPILVATTVLLVVLMSDDHLGRIEGVCLLLGLVVYTGWTLRAARLEPSTVQHEFDEVIPKPVGPAWRDVAFVAGGMLLLVGGAHLLVRGAVIVATAAGISDTVIGLTVVAIGTSLPELVTSFVAAVRRQSDIAVGNVVGSNIFNSLGIIGAAALARPIAEFGMRPVDFGVMLILTVILLPLMRTGFRLSRWEGGLLLAGYVAYLGYLLR